MLELLLEKTGGQNAEPYWVGPYWLAVIYTALGMENEAFTWLETAYDQRDGSLVFVKVDPVLDRLRTDKRYLAIVKRMGL